MIIKNHNKFVSAVLEHWCGKSCSGAFLAIPGEEKQLIRVFILDSWQAFARSGESAAHWMEACGPASARAEARTRQIRRLLLIAPDALDSGFDRPLWANQHT